ncbi:MAG: S-methyl-5'-thioinosine phosphorylase [Pseudomonadota bacterium]
MANRRKTIAIIGGTGFDQIRQLSIHKREVVRTPYGSPSGVLSWGELQGQSVVFLPRHGANHTIPPHVINYRANLWALQSVGVSRVIAFAAVGGISEDAVEGSIVVPDQLIDYTWGREHTFFDGKADRVEHIDFTQPYSTELRERLMDAAKAARVRVTAQGCYAATQGPRLETAAEIDRLERDGATIVGMTGMPEAALARELDLDYACLAIVVNKAAGRSDQQITIEVIRDNLKKGSGKAFRLLKHLSR